MRRVAFTIECRTAWWWTYLYVPAVLLMLALGATPNWAVVARDAERAVRIVLKPVRNDQVEL